MRYGPKILGIFMVLLGLLSACAPQYETRYELKPPSTASGLQCLKPCEAKAQQCRSQCSTQYASCSAKALETAKTRMPDLMRDYDVALVVWRADRDRYNQERLFYDMQRDQRHLMRDACEASGREPSDCPRMPRFGGWGRPSAPAPMPLMPSLERVAQQIRDTTCQSDCQCESGYRSCYSSCGGVVKPQPICVRNCN